jgi:hypothetical protein
VVTQVTEQAVLTRKTEVAYPFQFFCEERYSAEAVRELISEAYSEIMNEYDFDGPVAVGTMVYCMTSVFNTESIARLLLRDDFEGGPGGDMGMNQQMHSLFEESEMSVDEFLDELFSGEYDLFITRDERYMEHFAHDIYCTLRESGVFFVNSEFEMRTHQDFYRSKTSGRSISERLRNLRSFTECLVNCPIVEVW